MNGFNRSITKKLLNIEPHLSVSSSNENFLKDDTFLKSINATEYYKFSKQDVILRTFEGRFSGAIAKGIPTVAINDFLKRINKNQHEILNLRWNEIIIGNDLARNLNVFEGDEIMIISPVSLIGPQGQLPQYERMRIKAIFISDVSEIDSNLILFPFSFDGLRFQNKANRQDGFEVYLKNPTEFSVAQKKINKSLFNFSDLVVESWADRNKSLFFALRLEKVAMMSFLGLSILITCFSLITVLIMLISQKRKEIGILMALGMSRSKTSKLFMYLGLFLSEIGLFGGLILGVLVSKMIEWYPMNILPDIYYDSSVPSELNYYFVLFVAIFCFVIAFIAAYWPVKLYINKSPSENLRLFTAD
jgi:lipoprotein-releasing system permease protein